MYLITEKSWKIPLMINDIGMWFQSTSPIKYLLTYFVYHYYFFFYFQAWLDGKETTLLRPIYRGLPFAQENETC